MKFNSSWTFTFLFAVLTSSVLHGEDAVPPKADALTALGGKVTETSGAVTALRFSDCSKLGAAEFKLIGQVKTLKTLVLYGSCKGLNDETLASLSGLTDLDELGIDGMTLSDDGFKHFMVFKNLRSLSLFHPSWSFKSFTGTGLAHLKELPKLERLTFAGSTAGDTAMESVGQLTQLKDFRTWHTAQTQSGNEQLLKLVNLKELYIGQRLPMGGKPSPASFDDSTLATIAQIKSLERLTLTEAKLTLKGLEALKPLSNLKSLKFLQVDMAEEDVKKLDAAFPGIKVEFKPMSEKEREELIVKKLKL
jgi:hypothetical protein